MGRAYSHDLRERVVGADLNGGLSCHQAAAQFGVGISTAFLPKYSPDLNPIEQFLSKLKAGARAYFAPN
jgi:transposase